MRRPLALDEIADGILDGTRIDWTNVDADAALVEQLKTLETLRRKRAARALPDPPGPWTWGHLKVLERIGLGAYGDVYRAWDSRLDREVALKLLPSDEPGREASASTIIEEGRLLARVKHPNVVTIYGAERIDGRVGLWMELVKGQTLEEALRAGRTFTEAEVTRFGAELCDAVSAVHAAGLLHRDIKAQNVMLDDSGRLVLMDFGTGREFSDASDAQVAGTPLYLAPEVLAGKPATPQSDIYSIGVVLFRLLTDSYPVTAGTLADLRRAHETSAPDLARLEQAQVPTGLRGVISRALDPEPQKRFDGADQFRSALVGPARAPSPMRWGLIAASVLVIAAAAGFAWKPVVSMFTPVPRVAVLPFTDAGSDPGNDDFIDGFTTEVIRNLQLIDGLDVRSQASSFFFKDRPRNLLEVAKLLDVNMVLEGTVQRNGNRLQVKAQLVPVGKAPIWSETFDRTIDDVFTIRDEISKAIAFKLRLQLGADYQHYRTNSKVSDLYLSGRALAEEGLTQRATKGAVLLQQAIQLDPNFAPAYAALARAYSEMSWQPQGLSDGEGIAAMRPAAGRAIELAPELPEAHAAMGLVYARERDWENARKSFEQAIQLPPYSSRSVVMYASSTLYQIGEGQRAETLLEEALKQDPLSPVVRRELGHAQFVNGRFNEAVETFQQVRAANPNYGGTANILARALTQAGKPLEAIKFFESNPAHKEWERWLLPAYRMLNRTEDIDRLIRENEHGLPHRQAIIFAALGDRERTLAALDATIDSAPQRAAFMLACPEWAFLRGDPRFDELRKRLNLLR